MTPSPEEQRQTVEERAAARYPFENNDTSHVEAIRQRRFGYIDGDNARQKEVDDLLSLIGRMGEALELFTKASMGGSRGNEETWIGWQKNEGPSAPQRQAIARAVLKEYHELKK